MGPVNWIAVPIAALAAGGLAAAWFGPIFGRADLRGKALARSKSRTASNRAAALSLALLLLTAMMLGHLFARVGEATLEAKPWLYFMMSGGLAIAFVIPALWISLGRNQVPVHAALIDAGYWLTSYLAMGFVFFVFD